MPRTPIEEQSDSISGALEGLHREHVASFFAACAERFLPIYEEFSLQHGWGDAKTLRGILDSVWNGLEVHKGLRHWRDMATQVEANTPHSDDFGSIESVVAQDACILLDCALRFAAGDCADASTECAWYAHEAVVRAVCHDLTGYLDCEGDEASAVRVIGDQRFQLELAWEHEDIATLNTSDVKDQAIRMLRKRAHENAWTRHRLMQASRP